MNEKSNPMPMMYKTIPAVAELNKVPGFDPLKFLHHKVSRKTNEEMLQLELPYQKLWFRLRHLGPHETDYPANHGTACDYGGQSLSGPQ